MQNTTLMPDVLFKIEGKTYSIPATNVQTIVQMPSITAIPNAPNTIRGMIQYRNSVYKLIDLRKLLGLTTVQDSIDSFSVMMDERLNDHKNWLNELEASVKEGREFTLSTDPHKCKFGIWYDNFQTQNYMLREILDKFDAPHKRIHQIGVDVEKFEKDGDFESAQNLIKKTRDGDLKTMIELFTEVKEIYKNSLRELSIIIELNKSRCAIAVDSVVSVEKLEAADNNNSSKNYADYINSDFIDRISARKNGEFVISLCENSVILN